jgi:hypothetical protein
MKRKKILIVLFSLFVIKVLLNLTFKIQYSEDEFYEISNFRLNESTHIVSGKILFGKNVKGKIEAIIYPDKFLQNGIENEVEYIYMRFYPDWYTKQIEPLLTKTGKKINKELLASTKIIHKENFRNYMHLNDYPLIKKDFVPIVIKKTDIKEKERLSYDL